MTPQSKAILNALTHGHDEPWFTEPTLPLSCNDIFNLIESVHEVWYSPSGHRRDDSVSVGFIRLPHCVALNEHTARNYKLSVLSTSITSQFHKDYKLVLNLPQCSIEVQRALKPHYFLLEK